MNVSYKPSLSSVVQLLEKCGLPTSDLKTKQLDHFLYYGTVHNLLGIVGLELFGSVALLRSLAVPIDMQGKGYGKSLVIAAENHSRKNNSNEIYLLTETADAFFKKLNYQAIQRDIAPESIRSTSEFTGLCPDSATLMFKQLKG